MGNINDLKAAFAKDNFNVRDENIISYQGRIGMMAEHNTAKNSVNGQPKKAYYVEGSHYEMGYLLGCLAESEISEMTTDFADRIVISFINDQQEPDIVKILEDWLGGIILDIAKNLSKNDHVIVPPELREEMNGIVKGCQDVMQSKGLKTKVLIENLLALNFGHDILCSIIYTGDWLSLGLNEPVTNTSPQHFKMPMMCNGFSVFGKSAGSGHYMGRDFMFPTAQVYQKTACLIINNLIGVTSASGLKALPTVNMTAPGFVGSPTSMNSLGIACGVQIVASGNCTPDSIGINSLLLVRYAVQFADSAKSAVDIMEGLPRGVSWIYLIGDGANDRACVVEAGSSMVNSNFLFYPNPHNSNKELAAQLPSTEFLNEHKTADWQNGLMVRWNDYKYEKQYLSFNKGLLSWYKNKYPDSPSPAAYNATAFDDNGYIDKNVQEKNCPRTYFFSPMRKSNGDYVLTTNNYIIPEMRLAMMWEWSAGVNNTNPGNIPKSDDVQWRYDKLNSLFIDELSKGVIDYKKAKSLIDYLSPQPDNPYDSDCKNYADISNNPVDNDPSGRPFKRIEGSTSLLDLKNKTIEAHYGYYPDEWVKISLLNYL